jgi:uncharacterized membrane protein
MALIAIVTVLVVAIVLAPGALGTKIHFALHGVCAQRPSHSLRFTSDVLPLDARMTGLYTGAAIAALWLAARSDKRPWSLLSRPALVTLGLFGVLFVTDGMNALLLDLGLPHPYPPSNPMRLLTGILAGTSVGAVLAYLIALAVWDAGECVRREALGPSELVPPLAVSAGVGLLALSGFPVVFTPLAVWLLLATIAVFSALALVIVVLADDRARGYRSWADLAPLAVASVLIGVSIVGILAGLRLFAERVFALPQLT